MASPLMESHCPMASIVLRVCSGKTPSPSGVKLRRYEPFLLTTSAISASSSVAGRNFTSARQNQLLVDMVSYCQGACSVLVGSHFMRPVLNEISRMLVFSGKDSYLEFSTTPCFHSAARL